ncbi:iron complex transport system substrate-binding protein [Prauserella shujinwangii]|uniref:Iron complex transport system substrate-binding protein n=1 Tax=Prauserella shujinwangii TaxID=1453103 RepID=A0A2T0LKQ1_9PSEU|nr:iron-siderophore ABC transporter substrate-binding protein [Prauserella shujinwangii]PRX43478.1 iron complex transport system substrate-binding protein [Prauserella shujinwangii]
MPGKRLAALAGCALLLLGACGTTEPPAEGDRSPAPAGASGGPVTVTDSRGAEITLDAPAERVVALEWAEAEMLVTLGVMPVGVSQVEDYGKWVTAAKLDASVRDVGTRAEPNVDTIVGLEPDLVVMEGYRSAPLVEQLEQYVPVLVTEGSDAGDNLNRMRDDFTMIAEAVGERAEAERVLSGFDAALAETKRKIADAGAAGESFVIADGWQEGNAIAIRPYGEGALASQLAIAAGLRNAWPGEVDKVWGLGQTDVEGLTTITDEDARFLYSASGGEDVFADGLADNAIWKSLPFVRAGHVHRMSDGIWTFGGPASSEQFLDELVSVFAS